MLRWSDGWSVPTMKFCKICLRRKLVTSKLLRAWSLVSTLFISHTEESRLLGFQGTINFCLSKQKFKILIQATYSLHVPSFLNLYIVGVSIFRCKEHLYKRLRWSVGRSVRPPRCEISWKNSYVAIEIREEEEEEETDYVAIPLRRDSFAPRD
jgi:hypothetical protein